MKRLAKILLISSVMALVASCAAMTVVDQADPEGSGTVTGLVGLIAVVAQLIALPVLAAGVVLLLFAGRTERLHATVAAAWRVTVNGAAHLVEIPEHQGYLPAKGWVDSRVVALAPVPGRGLRESLVPIGSCRARLRIVDESSMTAELLLLPVLLAAGATDDSRPWRAILEVDGGTVEEAPVVADRYLPGPEWGRPSAPPG